jgi:hypothetical protein
MAVIRSSRIDGSLMNSRPCEHCIDLMRQIGIKTVLYSSNNASIIKENVDEMKQDHTSFGYKYLQFRMFPGRFRDPKVVRDEENRQERMQAELDLKMARKKKKFVYVDE